jgi:alpha-glucuronidase
MNKPIFFRLLAVCIMALAIPAMVFSETVGVFFDSNVAQIKFAAGDVKAALESKGFTVEMLPLTSLSAGYAKKKVVIALSSNAVVKKLLISEGGTIPANLGEQAYALRTTKKEKHSYWVLGGDINGAMYGGFQIAENISQDGFTETFNNEETPYLLARGMKLNLPLDKRIPTYIGTWSSNS